MLLRNIHVHVPIRRSQFCRERLNYDTIESNSRPFNRNRRGFLVPRSEKIDISKRRDTVDARHAVHDTRREK